MSFYANIGYNFSLPNESGVELLPDGSFILGSAMPIHQLERRKFDKKHPHLIKRLFDPQLYLAGLDANQAPKPCANLASYPWFGVSELNEYISKLQNQNQWKNAAVNKIADLWTRQVPSDPCLLNTIVADCIDFQRRIGCHAIILPSPLTTDPSTNYEIELAWLDSSLDNVRHHNIDIPVFATVAFSDICVNYIDPLNNNLLELILDSISAREVDGVYIVLEQGQEPSDARHCSSTRALQSVLHLVHIFSRDAGLRVATNFLGHFGLACEAAGAEIWGSGWYKSVYRLRLADKIGEGRAFPSYWTRKAATDIHLNRDFDQLNRGKLLIPSLVDRTEASNGLLMAAMSGRSSESVINWQYRQSNVKSAREHYFRSSIEAEHYFRSIDGASERLDYIEEWLQEAVVLSGKIESFLGVARKTNTSHVRSWLAAFRNYRADHKV